MLENRPGHCIIQLYVEEPEKSLVTFSSDFDSGNLSAVTQIAPSVFRIAGATDTKNPNNKSNLHFTVQGFPIGSRVKFIFQRINVLMNYLNCNNKDTSYQICVRREGHEWQRILEATSLSMNEEQQLELSFCYSFWQKICYSFAFIFPYPFLRYLQFLDSLQKEFQYHQCIYYNQETLIYSCQGRPVKMATISSKSNLSEERQEYLENLFPDRQTNTRSFQFKHKKPYILVTARVHPGQTPSSFVAEGLINFLLNPNDLRSHLLRQMFIFIVIPMLNPDGVFNGKFRYDSLNHNLNRYYNSATYQTQPSIYAVSKIIDSISDRLTYYFDLHAHHSPKGCFMYGNAFDDFAKQVQSKVFCRLMAINNSDFEYSACDFSPKHMVAKERYDKFSKEGCGRVFTYKKTQNVHCYTVQCGYYRNTAPNQFIQEQNSQFSISRYKLTQSENLCEEIFKTHNYRQIGRDLMITVLDSLQMNPYSKIEKTSYKDIETIRKNIAFQIFHQQERFRRFQHSIYKKIRNINANIGLYYENWIKIKRFFRIEGDFQDVKWPSCYKRQDVFQYSQSKKQLNLTVSNHEKKLRIFSKKFRKIQSSEEDELKIFAICDEEEKSNEENEMVRNQIIQPKRISQLKKTDQNQQISYDYRKGLRTELEETNFTRPKASHFSRNKYTHKSLTKQQMFQFQSNSDLANLETFEIKLQKVKSSVLSNSQSTLKMGKIVKSMHKTKVERPIDKLYCKGSQYNDQRPSMQKKLIQKYRELQASMKVRLPKIDSMSKIKGNGTRYQEQGRTKKEKDK